MTGKAKCGAYWREALECHFFFSRHTKAIYKNKNYGSQGDYPRVYKGVYREESQAYTKESDRENLPSHKQCPRECTKEFVQKKGPH